MRYEVWAKPPRNKFRVRIRIYPERLWQVACWTATVLDLSGYRDAVVKEVEDRPKTPEAKGDKS